MKKRPVTIFFQNRPGGASMICFYHLKYEPGRVTGVNIKQVVEIVFEIVYIISTQY